MLLSTSDFGKDGFRLHNFRHGEAPWQEKEWRTLVPLTLEVERNRNVSSKYRQLANSGEVAWMLSRRSGAFGLTAYLQVRFRIQ